MAMSEMMVEASRRAARVPGQRCGQGGMAQAAGKAVHDQQSKASTGVEQGIHQSNWWEILVLINKGKPAECWGEPRGYNH